MPEPLFIARPHVAIAFYEQGPWLIGVARLQGPSAPIILRARANLQDIERLVRQMFERRAKAAGIFGDIERAASSAARSVRNVARSRVAKSLYRQVRKTMKSPLANAAVAATAAVFPPVGVPAAAAFVTANQVLDKVEAGGAAAESAKRQIRALGKLAREPTPSGQKARKVAKVLAVTNSWRQGLKVARAARAPGAAARARHRDPADVRGELVLPDGRRLPVQGVERQGELALRIMLPGARPATLRARVQGGCGGC